MPQVATSTPDPQRSLRTDSLYEQVKGAGWDVLDECFSIMGVNNDATDLPSARKRRRGAMLFLERSGIKASEAGMANLHRLRNHWICEKVRREEAERPLPPDMEELTAIQLRRARAESRMEAALTRDLLTIAELELAESRAGLEERKVQALEAKVKLAEKEAERKILATQMEGAEFLDAVFSEAAKMEALRSEHAASVAAGETTAVRLARIVEKVWGAQVPGKEGA